MTDDKAPSAQPEIREKTAKDGDPVVDGRLDPERLRNLHKRHVQGALVRSGASVFMWFAALGAFYAEIIQFRNFLGVSACVLYLMIINPPTLWALKRIRGRTRYALFSMSINFLEIVGYTAIIYFLGGISSLWLCTIYAAVITYVAVVGSPAFPFATASFSVVCLGFLLTLEALGLLPPMDPFWAGPLPLRKQVMILLSSAGLLFVVAFIGYYTSSLMREQRKKLRVQDAKLNQSNSALQTAGEEIAKQNLELQEALFRVRQADRMKSEFLATMSHELRTPLNHIIGFSELILDRKFGDLNKTQEEYLGDILGSSRHLLCLINDILDLSKVEAGKMPFEPSDVDIRALFENSLKIVKEKALDNHLRLSLDLDALPGKIRADERKLKQIMFNLLSNAVKFTPDGGAINVSAEVLRRENGGWVGRGVALGSTRLGKGTDEAELNWLLVSVTDTGMGLRQENMEKIFEPFFQEDSGPNRKYQGTGLGLSLCRKYVALHGGEIWAEKASDDRGSRFCFTLPF